jgi:hypothetical protein
MNHRQGRLIFYESFHSPPFSHAGTFGVRWIIRPPATDTGS